MQKLKKINPLYLFLVLVLLVAFLTLLFLECSGRKTREEYQIPIETLCECSKDFVYEDGSFSAVSDDPWMDIDIPRGQYSELKLDVAALNKPSTLCAVYYSTTDDGNYSEERCIAAELTQQGVSIPMPEEVIDRIRLDLTNEPGVSIALNHVLLVPDDAITMRTWIMLACGLLLLLLLFAVISAYGKIARAGKIDEIGLKRGKRRSAWRSALGLDRLTGTEKYYLFLCMLVYAFWMLTFVSLYYGPDEYMRYQVPEFIFLNGSLPKGWEESIRNPVWGVSYGFDMTLPYLISAGFMKIASLFSGDAYVLLMAARLPSLLSMVGVGYFAILFSKKVLGDNPMRWIFIVPMTLLPQLVFLSSYVNLDTFSLFTAMMIIYSWVICLEKRWSLPSVSMLAVALGLCFLSYKFAYSYILVTVLLYFAWHIFNHRQSSFKSFMLKGLLIVGIAFAISGWKFIRSAILYEGDFLSLHASEPYAELYAQEAFKPSVRVSIAGQGIGLGYMLKQMQWINSTCRSFLGGFGYMSLFFPQWIYNAYRALVILGAAGTICKGAVAVIRRKTDGLSQNTVLVATGMVFASLITLCISIYYSWTSDYQAQGRYIITVSPMVFMAVTLGLDQCVAAICAIPGLRLLRQDILRKLVAAIVIAFVVFSMFYGTQMCLKEFGYPGQIPSWVNSYSMN